MPRYIDNVQEIKALEKLAAKDPNRVARAYASRYSAVDALWLIQQVIQEPGLTISLLLNRLVRERREVERRGVIALFEPSTATLIRQVAAQLGVAADHLVTRIVTEHIGDYVEQSSKVAKQRQAAESSLGRIVAAAATN